MIRRHRFRPSPVPVNAADRVRSDERRAATSALLERGSAARERLVSAPVAYVLAHRSSDIARHSELRDPVAGPDDVRVVVTPTRTAGQWQCDIVTRDRPGLLAAFSGALARENVDVVQAVLATWPDGAALQAFTVRSERLNAERLHAALAASLAVNDACVPLRDACVAFDNHSSPLYTSCEVSAPDRPGILYAIAVAISTAGADIHAASVSTAGGYARDLFDLSDRAGSKLDDALRQRITELLRTGMEPAMDRREAARRRTRVVPGVDRCA